MLTSLERRLEMVNLIGLKRKIHVDELVEHFNVTGATIRADLRHLAENGFINRAHGYALEKNILTDINFKENNANEPSTINSNSNSIHSRLTELIQEEIEQGSIIFVDASPTIREAFKNLDDIKGATIVTRDLNLIQNMTHIKNGQFFITGGRVDTESMRMTGSQMINSLKTFRFNKAFITADAFNFKLGAFSNCEFDAQAIGLLTETSEELVIVNVHSIFESSATQWACEPSKINRFLIKDAVSTDVINKALTHKIEIITPNQI